MTLRDQGGRFTSEAALIARMNRKHARTAARLGLVPVPAPPAAERNPESDPQLAELTEAREARIVAERDLAALERKLDQQ